jgi:predicted ester cyclase
MSVKENKAICHVIMEEVYNKGNLELLDRIVDSNFSLRPRKGNIQGLEEYKKTSGKRGIRGLEEYKRFISKMRDAFPDLHFTMGDLIAEGDTAMFDWTWTGTHKGEHLGILPTGKKVSVYGMSTARFSGDKMVEACSVMDRLDMMQQMGVIPKQ